MQYPVPVEGFDRKRLLVETPGFFSSARLMLDGQPAPKGPKRGEYLLHRDDGTEVTAKLKNLFLDPIPQVVIDNQVTQIVEPLHWYQWLWAGLPILLIFSGGALGGALGFVAISFNTRIFRSDLDTATQYGFVALVSIGAALAYFITATILISMLR